MLYGNVGISIHPERMALISKDMLSWFPLFIPLKVFLVAACRALMTLTSCVSGSSLPPRRCRAHCVHLATDRCAQGVVRMVRGSLPARPDGICIIANLARHPVADEPVAGQQLPQPSRLNADNRYESFAGCSSSHTGGPKTDVDDG